MASIWELFATIGISYTLAVVALGAIVMGFLTGVLSVLFVNQRRAILGDTIAHTTLPGIALTFLVLQDKNRLLLLVGALSTSIIAILLVQLISRRTSLKDDVAIGISMSFFTGLGIALLSFIQRLPVSSQAGITHYMFGNLAFLLLKDLYLIVTLSMLVLFVIVLFYKEFKLLVFDREYAVVLGLPVGKLEALLLVLVAFAIVISVESMGVLLIAGLLIGPAIAARYWSNSFVGNILLAGVLGAVSGVFGVYASSKTQDMPPGPAIIIVLSALVLLSLIFGARNGLLLNWMHSRIFHRNVNHQITLEAFIKGANGLLKDKGLRVLEFDLDEYPGLNEELVNTLCVCGYCKKLTQRKFVLTYKGVKATQRALTSRRSL